MVLSNILDPIPEVIAEENYLGQVHCSKMECNPNFNLAIS